MARATMTSACASTRQWGQELLAIRAGRRYVIDVQDQLAVKFGAHGHLETVEAVGGTLAAVPHLGIGDADDAVRGRALTDLRGALGVLHHVIAQNLAQEPAGGPHFGVVALGERQVQRRLRILDQHLQLPGPGRRIGPVDVGFVVRLQVGGDQPLGRLRQTVALTRHRIAQLLQQLADALAQQRIGVLHGAGALGPRRIRQQRNLVRNEARGPADLD